MDGVLIAVLLLAALGLIAGLMLAVASALMAVPVDEKTEALEAALPGINCGACGYSGCAGYADAMAVGEAAPGLCSPGGAETARATAELLGVAGVEVSVQIAAVLCGGADEFSKKSFAYRGVASCQAASQYFGGDRFCKWGCLGYGDCVSACAYGAISVRDGLARIDAAKCVGCTACVAACPKSIIEMTPGAAKGVVRCASRDKGGVTRKQCGVGCIGCMKCVKVCAFDAIHVENYLARIDPGKCTGCGACADVCPVECITIFGKKAAKSD